MRGNNGMNGRGTDFNNSPNLGGCTIMGGAPSNGTGGSGGSGAGNAGFIIIEF
jgi:hypothetical protein